jgi:hypothetical protein
MMGKHVRERPKMRWLVMDATAMKVCTAHGELPPRGLLMCIARSVAQFADGSFDTVVDKGALDALMGEEGAEGAAQGAALLAECCRVAHPSRGAVAVVSLLQDHVLEALLHTFRSGWQVSIRQVPPSRDMLTSPLQPFFVLARAAADDVALPGVAADADAAPVPAAAPAAAVEFAAPPAGGASGAGRVINAEQLRDVALLVARENAARAAGTAQGVRPLTSDRSSVVCLTSRLLYYRARRPGATRSRSCARGSGW